MDHERFDDLVRTIVSRRSRRRLAGMAVTLLGGLLVNPLFDDAHDVLAKNKRGKGKGKKRKKKKQPDCPAGQRRCQGQCIANDGCCSDSECWPRGECAACSNGQCVLNGPFCQQAYGPCYVCHDFTCTPNPIVDGMPCGPDCAVCRKGQCVGCERFGECAYCSGGECLPDGTICVEAYGLCHSCRKNVGTITCVQTGIPCGEYCCESGKDCCTFNFEPPDDQQCWPRQDPCGDCEFPCGEGNAAVCCKTTESCCDDPNFHCVGPGATCP